MATEKELINAIYNELSGDTTLSGYVAEFGRGFLGAVDNMPFVQVDILSEEIEPLTIGPRGKDRHTYTFSIECGVYNLASDAALLGDDSNKGILDLVDDIKNVCRTNKFDVFAEPVEVTDIQYVAQNDFTLRGAQITLQGVQYKKRNIV